MNKNQGIAATLLCLYYVHPLPCAYAHGYKDTGATRLLAKHTVLQMIHFYYILHGMVLCNVIAKAKPEAIHETVISY
jgi:hypothetical protein